MFEMVSALLPDILGRLDAIMSVTEIATAIDLNRLQDAERSYLRSCTRLNPLLGLDLGEDAS